MHVWFTTKDTLVVDVLLGVQHLQLSAIYLPQTQKLGFNSMDATNVPRNIQMHSHHEACNQVTVVQRGHLYCFQCCEWYIKGCFILACHVTFYSINTLWEIGWADSVDHNLCGCSHLHTKQPPSQVLAILDRLLIFGLHAKLIESVEQCAVQYQFI